MDLSIVIVSWNTADLLLRCLQSIYANAPSVRFDIWIVDNASTDDSVRCIQANYPGVHLLLNKKNVGFARANNEAIQQCSGRYVLLLNPDTLVHPDALDRLVNFMGTHPDAGACGSRYLNPDGTLQWSCAPFPTLSREFWRMNHLDVVHAYGKYDMAHWDIHQVREVEVLQGASLLIKREVINQVGLLDPGYFMYTEETDLCYRIYQAGWKLYWVPESTITHFGGQSTQQVADTMFLRLYESKVIFMRKHYGSWSAFVYKLILGTSALTRIIAIPIAWCFIPAKRQMHRNLARNYSNLISALPDF
jgi:GT2 family glycosyltransferase